MKKKKKLDETTYEVHNKERHFSGRLGPPLSNIV